MNEEAIIFEEFGTKIVKVSEIKISGTQTPQTSASNVSTNEHNTAAEYDPCVVQDSFLLSEAAYCENPCSFLTDQGHRFTSVFVGHFLQEDGHYLIAYRDDVVYLAIRGSSNSSDWKMNFSAWTTVESIGIVHHGWYSRSAHIPTAYLLHVLEKENKKVVICGHSLGGAVATIVTVRLLQQLVFKAQMTELAKCITCVTFAAPLVMTGLAAENIHSVHNDRFIHFIHPRDVVPKILTLCSNIVQNSKLSTNDSTEKAMQVMISLGDAVNKSLRISHVAWEALKLFAVSSVFKNLATTIIQDLWGYQPFGKYFVVGEGYDPRHALDHEAAKELLSYKNIVMTPDLLIAHKLSFYVSYIQQSSLKVDTRSYLKVTPNPFTPTPQPVIMKIVMKRTTECKNRMHFTILGENLFAIKCLESADIAGYALKHNVENASEYQNGCLCFTENVSKTSEINTIEKAKNIFSNTAWVTVTSFFDGLGCTPTAIPNVLVHRESNHAFETFTLQELVVFGLYILLFASDEDTSSSLDRLRYILNEIFGTIPAHAFIYYSSHIGQNIMYHKVLRDMLLKSTVSAQNAMRLFVKDGKKLRKDVETRLNDTSTTDPQHKIDLEAQQQRFQSESWIEIENSVKASHAFDLNDEEITISHALEILFSEERIDSLNGMLKILSGSLHDRKLALKANTTAESYRQFLAELSSTFGMAKIVSNAVGLFYHKSQDDMGDFYRKLEAILTRPFVQKSINLMMGSLAIVSVGIVFMYSGPIGFLFLSGVGAIGGGLNAVALKALDNSKTLCKWVLELCNAANDNLETHGDFEDAVAKALGDHHNSPINSFRKWKTLIQRKYVGLEEDGGAVGNIPCRVKLILLSDYLRKTLQSLPLILLSGLTCSGKSTLREMLINPQEAIRRKKYGPLQEYRTLVPEIHICGEPGRTYGILDTIGLSDQTLLTNKINLAEEIKEINNLFECFASATILVCGQNDDAFDNKEAISLTAQTTSMEVSGRRAIINHPTLTCFNKADTMIFSPFITGPEDDESGRSPEEQSKDLCIKWKVEIESRIGKGRFFDLRSTHNDMTTPRVLSIFDPKCLKLFAKYPEIKFPDGQILMTPSDVHNWILDIFHPRDKK
eukprot:gene23548-30535_t